jgi:hypothetical protein
MDLEHSFGPAYVRGRLLKGTAAEAVIGVSEAESGPMVDGILTLGILWLDYCRQHGDGRRHFGGLKVIVPAGAWRTTAERMAWLNHGAADFQLFTLDERSEELARWIFATPATWIAAGARVFNAAGGIERCRGLQSTVDCACSPAARERVEVRPESATEVGLLLHGLEFARVRHGFAANSFAREDEITFGAGANETPLTAENETLCRDLFSRLFLSRHARRRAHRSALPLQPEHWLESRLRRRDCRAAAGVARRPAVLAGAGAKRGDRGLLDLLTLDRNGRLAVIELKADEDLHLPLQALDYWIRVRALNSDRQPAAGNEGGRPLSAFERQGYFAGAEVAPLAPRLLLAGPALRIHPANEPVLRYLSLEVEWELIALTEHWRRELKVVFRKRSGDARS